MKSRFHICLLISMVMASTLRSLADDKSTGAPVPSRDPVQNSGAQTNAAGTNGVAAASASNAAPPVITGVVPGAPLIAPNQPLTISGSNFQNNISIRFVDAEDHEYDGRVMKEMTTSNRLFVVTTFGSGGQWKAIAANPGGPDSKPFKFAVANAPMPDWSFRIGAFIGAALVVTILLGWIFLALREDLKAAQTSKQWSFGDALSEESAYQPKEIRQKSDVILLASSSRLIALLGLMGILTTVLGIGYAIMWNLFLYGTVPDLTEVRAFLYGAACLFAPYLANQLSGAFTPSSKAQPASAPASNPITGIAPESPTASANPQPLQITGNGFQQNLALTLVDPVGAEHPVDHAAITVAMASLINANVVLNTPGTWAIRVTNTPNAPAQSFRVTVTGAPAVTGVDPALANQAAEQQWTFNGSGFMSGLTVTLANPASATIQITIVSLTTTSLRVRAVLATAGAWRATITNPNSQPLTYPFQVT